MAVFTTCMATESIGRPAWIRGDARNIGVA